MIRDDYFELYAYGHAVPASMQHYVSKDHNVIT